MNSSDKSIRIATWHQQYFDIIYLFMTKIIIEELRQTPVVRLRVELVERKGTGHPDTICDAIMEEVSVDLCREYLAAFGHILHYNADKALLVAGRTEPRPGGGECGNFWC